MFASGQLTQELIARSGLNLLQLHNSTGCRWKGHYCSSTHDPSQHCDSLEQQSGPDAPVVFLQVTELLPQCNDSCKILNISRTMTWLFKWLAHFGLARLHWSSWRRVAALGKKDPGILSFGISLAFDRDWLAVLESENYQVKNCLTRTKFLWSWSSWSFHISSLECGSLNPCQDTLGNLCSEHWT